MVFSRDDALDLMRWTLEEWGTWYVSPEKLESALDDFLYWDEKADGDRDEERAEWRVNLYREGSGSGVPQNSRSATPDSPTLPT